MGKIVFYKNEKNSSNIGLNIIIIIGLMLLLNIIYLKITAPNGFTSDAAFVATIAFMIVWFVITIYFKELFYKKRKEVIDKRDEIIKNGELVKGIIVDISQTVSYSRDSENRVRKSIHNTPVVNFEYKGENVEYYTSEITFNPRKLISNEVDVYIYDGEHYVGGFKIGNESTNLITINGSKENPDDKISIGSFIMSLGQILFIIIIVIWIMLSAKDQTSVLIATPFLILCIIFAIWIIYRFRKNR